jgi:iron complex transport system permease protein
MIPNRPRGAVVWIALLALAVALLAPLLGAKRLDARAVVTGRPDDADRRIFLMLRLPRVALSFLVGAALAASGAAFQALFRNALAEPFTLGVSSGASFGAAVYVRFLAPFIVLGFPGVAVFAFMGAMGSVALVYGLARETPWGPGTP